MDSEAAVGVGAPVDMSEGTVRGSGSGRVLAVLAASQFLMTLDSSVMNVSLADVARDVGTPITGVQTAITLYTLVMATLMISGGKLGEIMGRKWALAAGLVIYGMGSLTTALAPNLPVLLVGWSGLEGIGAALILPALVALVAGNFGPERRAAAYGTLAAAGAMAVAVGPLVGGAVTTFASWRYVFAGEVVVVVLVLGALRTVRDAPAHRERFDVFGAVLSVVALGAVVLGVLKSSEWGWVVAKAGAPALAGTSPVLWMILGGMLCLYGFFAWQTRRVGSGQPPLLSPDLLQNSRLTGGLSVFFAQFLIQAGTFFALPLFLTVVLGLDAVQTGLRVFPLSMALVIVAAGLPRLVPNASPRRVARVGLAGMIVALVLLSGGMDPGANAAVVAAPMLLMGAGLGALSSQLGNVTVSSVREERATEVGALQNTATNLGASLGTALVGSVLISALGASVIVGLQNDSRVPDEVARTAAVRVQEGVPFMSDRDLVSALERADVQPQVADAVVEANAQARLDALRKAFGLSAVLAVLALFLTGRLPDRQPGRQAGAGEVTDR